MIGITTLFTGTTLIAAVGYLAYQLRGLPYTIWNQIDKYFFYKVTITDDSQLMIYLDVWLKENKANTLRSAIASISTDYTGFNKSEDTDNRSPELVLSYGQDSFIIKYKGKRFFIVKNIDQNQSSLDRNNKYTIQYRIYSFMGKKEVNSFLEDVVTYNVSKVRVCSIYTNTKYGEWCKVSDNKSMGFSNVVFHGNDELTRDLDEFTNSEKWYVDRGLKYKRGYLLYGPPGNGKSSLALAMAKYLDRDIYTLSLSILDDDSYLVSTIKSLPSNSILLIEDVDSFWEHRESKTSLTFSGFINNIDGIVVKHGVIVILTTNHIDRLDPALTRKGRMDVSIEIPKPDVSAIEKYLHMFYETDVIPNTLTCDNNLSMCDVQEICLKNKNDMGMAINDINKSKTA